MMQNIIGLMMIRDEQDMLVEALKNHSCFCSAILVLDGSCGQSQTITRDICNQHPSIIEYWHDDDTGYDQPLRDGGRQFLLERAREIFGLNQWYAVLHGDELWAKDPRAFLCIPEEPYGVETQLYHFFPHTTERKTWAFPGNGSIESTARWYMMPPGKEHRLFFDSGKHDYVVDQHSTTIPPDITRITLPIPIKQYNYRTPEQSHKRANDRKQSNWQKNHYQHLLNGPEGFFVDSLAVCGHKWLGWIPAGQGQVTNITANPLPTLSCPDKQPDRQPSDVSHLSSSADQIKPVVQIESAPTSLHLFTKMLSNLRDHLLHYRNVINPKVKESVRKEVTCKKQPEWRDRLSNYRDLGHTNVQGWMRKEVFGALEVAQIAHEQLDIQGSIVEIGIYHGAFFLALDQLRRPNEKSAAFDIFSLQELNIDGSGKGDRDVFEENLQQYGSDPDSVVIVQADSTTLVADDVLQSLGGQRPRLFSIDGGHTKAHVFSDLSLAEKTLHPGGIVFVDDYMHPAWPEVTEGLHLWMQSHDKLKPFAWVGRKLLMTTVEHQSYLLNCFMEHKDLIPAARHKEVTLFDCPVLAAIPDWFIG